MILKDMYESNSQFKRIIKHTLEVPENYLDFCVFVIFKTSIFQHFPGINFENYFIDKIGTSKILKFPKIIKRKYLT